MAIQIVMDHNGDSRFEFDPADKTAVARGLPEKLRLRNQAN